MSIWLWVLLFAIIIVIGWGLVVVCVDTIQHRRQQEIMRTKVEATRMRVQANQVDREHRAYLEGSDYGVYGNYAPIDPDTGLAKDLGKPDQRNRSVKAFRANFKGLDVD